MGWFVVMRCICVCSDIGQVRANNKLFLYMSQVLRFRWDYDHLNKDGEVLHGSAEPAAVDSPGKSRAGGAGGGARSGAGDSAGPSWQGRLLLRAEMPDGSLVDLLPAFRNVAANTTMTAVREWNVPLRDAPAGFIPSGVAANLWHQHVMLVGVEREAERVTRVADACPGGICVLRPHVATSQVSEDDRLEVEPEFE
jgi:hypothetical protein